MISGRIIAHKEPEPYKYIPPVTNYPIRFQGVNKYSLQEKETILTNALTVSKALGMVPGAKVMRKTGALNIGVIIKVHSSIADAFSMGTGECEPIKVSWSLTNPEYGFNYEVSELEVITQGE